MKLSLSKRDLDRLDDLFLEKEMNIAAADGLFQFCFHSAAVDILDKDYSRAVKNYLDLNLLNQEDKYFFDTRILPAVKEIKNEDYDNDYYRKNIKPSSFKGNGYQLTYLKIKPYQAIPYDDVLIDDNLIEVSKIGYFTKDFEYLAVMKDDVVWMSTDPNEINTMREAINSAYGHVLAFGLGLGYFPIMCAIKENVKDVTIVEKDPKIIEIFKKHILPLFEYKDKIHIIEDDAFNYVKKDLKPYNYLFIDIWHNPEDGLPMYLKFKRLLKGNNIDTSYWLEKSILAMYRRCLLTVMEEAVNGYMKKNYLKAENEYDHIINDLYFKTENKTFNSFDEIKEILQDRELKKFI